MERGLDVMLETKDKEASVLRLLRTWSRRRADRDLPPAHAFELARAV